MNEDEVKKLAEEYWQYAESTSDTGWCCHKMYVDAFIHGFKHGKKHKSK